MAKHGKHEMIKNLWLKISEGKRLLGRPRRRRERNIKKYLTEIMWEAVQWVHVARNRDQWRAVLNTAMKFLVTKETGRFLAH
jgi:hypothetical protein